MELQLVGILSPLIINWTLLFARKKKWALSKYRWYAVSALFISAILSLLILDVDSLKVNDKLAIWGIMTPLLFSLLDLLFKNVSKQLHNRDLHLWIRGSDDIDSSKLSGGKHVRASDRLLSMILLFTVLFFPFLTVGLIAN